MGNLQCTGKPRYDTDAGLVFALRLFYLTPNTVDNSTCLRGSELETDWGTQRMCCGLTAPCSSRVKDRVPVIWRLVSVCLGADQFPSLDVHRGGRHARLCGVARVYEDTPRVMAVINGSDSLILG